MIHGHPRIDWLSSFLLGLPQKVGREGIVSKVMKQIEIEFRNLVKAASGKADRVKRQTDSQNA
jgi:hypothetical protein